MEISKKYKLLLVDDLPLNLKVLGNLLKKQNYELVIATNGEEALEKVKNENPDLILLDIMMPGIDGFEVCKRIKNNPHNKEIPVIFITAKSEVSNIVQGFQAGASDYISKPFNSEELLARISTQLELVDSRRLIKKYNQNLEDLLDKKLQKLVESNRDLKSEIVEKNKIHDELIYAKEKAEKNNLLKSEFLSKISDEMKKPLDEIFNNNRLAQLKLDKNGNEILSDYLANIEENSNQIKHKLEAIINNAEIFNVDCSSRIQKFDMIKDVLIKITDIYNLEMDYQLDRNEIVELEGDKETLESLFGNLIEIMKNHSEDNKLIFKTFIKENDLNFETKVVNLKNTADFNQSIESNIKKINNCFESQIVDHEIENCSDQNKIIKLKFKI